MKKSLLILILTGLILAACGAPATEPAVKPDRTRTAAEWTAIRMSQSGGLAGVSRTISISRDGHGSVMDESAGKNAALTLTPEQLVQLEAIMASFTKLPKVELDLNCADCFVYTLGFSFPERNRTVQLSDTQLAASGYEPLVTFLRTLLDTTLQ